MDQNLVCSLMDEDITIIMVGTCIIYMCKAMNNSKHIFFTITLAASGRIVRLVILFRSLYLPINE